MVSRPLARPANRQFTVMLRSSDGVPPTLAVRGPAMPGQDGQPGDTAMCMDAFALPRDALEERGVIGREILSCPVSAWRMPE